MKRNIMALVIMLFFLMISGSVFADGYLVTSDLWIRAVIDTVEKGPIEAVWQKGGEDTTSRGDRVIWGHFYASPSDVTWGSQDNPDLFVKIWFDVSGRVDVNFFHVSVPNIEVYSDYQYDGSPDEQGTTTMDRRYIRQYYENSQSYSDEQTEDGNPPSGYSPSGNPFGFTTINNLRIGALVNTVEKGPIDAVWHLGGQNTTTRGDQVVWGHFYASPSDVTWGSQNNPDLFVKIWFDASGRIDVNFFHVSVPNIEVCSDYPRDGTYDQRGITIMANRYIRDEYWTTDNQEASISPDSVVLDDETTQGLSSVSSDNSTLTFDSLTSALQTLQQNDVIAIGVTEKTPYGLLRKVASVTQQGNQVVVQTTQAKLTDVIEQGSISVSKTLTTSDINASGAIVKTLKGVSLRPIPKVKNARAAAAAVGIDPDNELFNLELAGVVLYDHDGNDNTTYDQIVADGGISFGLDFDIEIQLKWWKIQYLSFTTTPWQTAEIEISSSISKSIEKKVEIAQYYTSPITVLVGGWPVIMVPVVTLYVGLDGEVSVDITTGVTQSASITAGVEYQDSEWSPISGYSLDFDYQPPVLSASASAKAYVEPEFTLLIYGVAGPYATLQGYLQLNADINDDPWWSLYAGIAVGAGVEVEVIGREIVDFGIPDIIDYQKLLAEAETLFNIPPTATIMNPSDGDSFDVEETIYFDGSGSDSDGEIVSYKWVFEGHGWTTDQNTSLSYSSAGTYTVTLTVTDDDGATGTDSISVAITSSNNYADTVTDTISVGDSPHGVAVSPNGSYVYVASGGGGTVSVMRTSDNAVIDTISVDDGTFYVAVSPNGSYVYVTSGGGGGTVSVMRTSDNTVIDTISVGGRPYGVAVSPNGSYVYVANYDDDTVSVIRTSDNTVIDTISVGDPFGVAVSPNGSYVFVTSIGGGSTVSVIQTSDNTVIDTISVGDGTFYVAVSPNGSYVYVTNGGGGTVSVMRTSDNTVIDTISVGSAYGVAVSPNGSYVYVTNYDDDTVSVIRTSDNTVVDTISVGVDPYGVAVSPNGSYVYVTNGYDDTVSVIRISDTSPTATITSPSDGSTFDVDETITFQGSGSDTDGSIVSYEWDFGDGSTSTQQNPSHAYSSADTYTVTLTVTDDDGATGTDSISITVGDDKPYDLTLNIDSGTLNGTFVSNDSTITVSTSETILGSVDINVINNGPSGSICPVAWTPTWGDNATSYSQIDSWGSGTETYTVDISLTAPDTAGDYYLYFVTGYFYHTGNLMSGTAGSTTSYQWDSDGTDVADWSSAVRQDILNKGYTLQSPQSDGNDAFVVGTYITVNVVPSGNISPTASITSPSDGATFDVGETVSFQGSGSDTDGTIVSYKWDFGDVSTSTDQNPSHAYSSAGDYTVSLTVTDDDGTTGSTPISLTINAPPVSWTISTVDSDGNMGVSNSLALDANGKVHIAYRDSTNDDLRYATNASGSWTSQVIDSFGDVGSYISVAIDSNDKVHISYQDCDNEELKYATNASGSWVTYTIDDSWLAGRSTSIAIDSNNKIHISYHDNSSYELKYATNVSGSWVMHTVDTEGYAGWPNSIAIDSINNVHISYCVVDEELKYATNASGAWVTSTIDSAGDWFSKSSIVIDSNDKVHICYRVTPIYNDLKYATNASGAWVTSTIDSVGDVGSNNSMVIDSNDRVHIAYRDITNAVYKYATNTSGAWVTCIIDSVPGSTTSIGIGPDSDMHISYYDSINDDLKYARSQ